jgi:hypothetical protein
MGELAIEAGQNGCRSVGILPGLLLVAAEHIAPPLQRRLLDGELALADSSANDTSDMRQRKMTKAESRQPPARFQQVT